MAIADQGVLARRAEAAAEPGDVAGAQMLIAEHQHRMLGESLPDPGEGRVVEPCDRSTPSASVPSASPSGRNCRVSDAMVMADPPGWGNPARCGMISLGGRAAKV